MGTRRAKKALEELARQKGVSIGAIRREIERAIAEAMKNPDPEARAFWAAASHSGKTPTPEEFIAYLARK